MLFQLYTVAGGDAMKCKPQDELSPKSLNAYTLIHGVKYDASTLYSSPSVVK